MILYVPRHVVRVNKYLILSYYARACGTQWRHLPLSGTDSAEWSILSTHRTVGPRNVPRNDNNYKGLLYAPPGSPHQPLEQPRARHGPRAGSGPRPEMFLNYRVGRGNKPTRGDRPTPIYSSPKDARDYLYCAIPSHHIGVTSFKSSSAHLKR